MRWITSLASATLRLISPEEGKAAMRSPTRLDSDWLRTQISSATSSHGIIPLSQ
ncbi:hypothetical protein D3C78_1815510 [compost metagenome]